MPPRTAAKRPASPLMPAPPARRRRAESRASSPTHALPNPGVCPTDVFDALPNEVLAAIVQPACGLGRADALALRATARRWQQVVDAARPDVWHDAIHREMATYLGDDSLEPTAELRGHLRTLRHLDYGTLWEMPGARKADVRKLVDLFSGAENLQQLTLPRLGPDPFLLARLPAPQRLRTLWIQAIPFFAEHPKALCASRIVQVLGRLSGVEHLHIDRLGYAEPCLTAIYRGMQGALRLKSLTLACAIEFPEDMQQGLIALVRGATQLRAVTLFAPLISPASFTAAVLLGLETQNNLRTLQIPIDETDDEGIGSQLLRVVRSHAQLRHLAVLRGAAHPQRKRYQDQAEATFQDRGAAARYGRAYVPRAAAPADLEGAWGEAVFRSVATALRIRPSLRSIALHPSFAGTQHNMAELMAGIEDHGHIEQMALCTLVTAAAVARALQGLASSRAALAVTLHNIDPDPAHQPAWRDGLMGLDRLESLQIRDDTYYGAWISTIAPLLPRLRALRRFDCDSAGTPEHIGQLVAACRSSASLRRASFVTYGEVAPLEAIMRPLQTGHLALSWRHDTSYGGRPNLN
jgi:hypothetical protein